MNLGGGARVACEAAIPGWSVRIVSHPVYSDIKKIHIYSSFCVTPIEDSDLESEDVGKFDGAPGEKSFE